MAEHEAVVDAVKADASNRAWRTFVVNLGIDIAVAVATVLSGWIGDADLSNPNDWKFLALSVAKTLIATVGAYVLRKAVAPAVNTQAVNPRATIADVDG